MKFQIQREFEVDPNEIIKEYELCRGSTKDEVYEVVDDYVVGMDDVFYYSWTKEMTDRLVANIMDILKDYTGPEDLETPLEAFENIVKDFDLENEDRKTQRRITKIRQELKRIIYIN